VCCTVPAIPGFVFLHYLFLASWLPPRYYLPILFLPFPPPHSSVLLRLQSSHIQVIFIMLPSMVLMSALAATAFGANTTYTYTFPAGFNIGLVKPDQLSSLTTNSF
jgi:hypothetical protein